MSTVFLQVGQCGNQVGQNLWKKFSKDEEVISSCTYITNDGKYRAVVVDSEPKVVRRITKGSHFREKSIVVGKRGRGANWALGYHGLQNAGDDHLLEDTIEAVRTEVERCDRFNGIIMLHSLSGGTGSGLGSRLIECLRDDYSLHHLMSCTFAPCTSGESPLQHYNSLLTLAALQRNTDCVVVTNNDDVLYRVQKMKGDLSVSFANLNETIASHLCGVFLPTDSLKTRKTFSVGMEPWEMLRSICPMPNLKFAQVAQYTSSKMSWEGVFGQLALTLKKFDQAGSPYSSLSNIVVARGDTTGGFHLHTGSLDVKVRKAYNCVGWNPFPVDYWSARTNNCGPMNSASLTVASNNSSVTELLSTCLERSKVMYKEGAYLHWYKKYHATEDNFEEAFEDVQSVIEDYNSAVK